MSSGHGVNDGLKYDCTGDHPLGFADVGRPGDSDNPDGYEDLIIINPGKYIYAFFGPSFGTADGLSGPHGVTDDLEYDGSYDRPMMLADYDGNGISDLIIINRDDYVYAFWGPSFAQAIPLSGPHTSDQLPDGLDWDKTLDHWLNIACLSYWHVPWACWNCGSFP